MPRTVPDALTAHLQGSVLTLATCVKVVRKDGLTLGFTSHDLPLLSNGVEYFPSGSMSASAVQSTTSVSSDNLEVTGVLTDDRITESDLAAGRYDEARVWVYKLNWQDPSAGQVCIFHGLFGEVTLKDGSYRAELRSLTDLLKANIGESTSPICRCRRLGDSRCKVSMVGLVDSLVVSSVISSSELVCTGSARTAGFYNFGRLKVASGAAAGAESDVKDHVLTSGSCQLTLRAPLTVGVAIGDSITVEAGCDRLMATCLNRYNNLANFRAEPLLPGNDQILKIARAPG